MLQENSLKDPTVTVESEKQTITIGKGVPYGAALKPVITVEKEKEILDEIERHCAKWSRIANIYVACIIIFGTLAVSTSVLVSIYTGNEAMMSVKTIKIMACISTISLAILTAFNLVPNSINAKNAWRSLNAAMMMYTAGSLSLQELIEQYQKGENQFGNFTFKYGANSESGSGYSSNAERPATYAHDVVASDEERKKEAQAEIQKQKDVTNGVANGTDEGDKQLNGPATATKIGGDLLSSN
jgi:hypothetical protein